VDLEKRRLFVAAVTNNTLKVANLTGGKTIRFAARKRAWLGMGIKARIQTARLRPIR
jgi:hypothetical protein